MMPRRLGKIRQLWNPKVAEAFVAQRSARLIAGSKNTDVFDVFQHKYLRKFLPGWHLSMIRDRARNLFYRDLINDNVRGRTVLEIGAGTGYLAILSAKAGAKHVYACELNPLLFVLAKRNIAREGLDSKISLFNCHSSKLRIGKQLPGKVDIILSEIISTSIFREGLIPSLKGARSLLKPKGIYLPEKVQVRARLVKAGAPGLATIEGHGIFNEIQELAEAMPRVRFSNSKKTPGLSDDVLVSEITMGYKLKPTLPRSFSLKLKAKTKADKLGLNVYFVISNGNKSLSNYLNDQNECAFAKSWGQIVWPVKYQEQYKFRALLDDAQQELVIKQHIKKCTK